MNFIQEGYKGKNDWWMYIITLFIVFVATQLGSLPLAAAALMQVDGDMQKFQSAAETAFLNIGMDSNLYLFLMILSFAFGLLALYICVTTFHRKKWKNIITTRGKIDWNRFFYGALLWGGFSVVFIFIGMAIHPENFIWNFKPIPFVILLFVSFLFLPFQTSTEEILFRGYFMQGLGLLLKSRWIPLLITSLMFGLLHGANPEIDKLGQEVLIFYVLTGLFFGVVTLLDDGLELAMGMHAINNIIAAFLVTTDWMVFRTDALFIDKTEPTIGWEMIVPVVIIYPLLLVIFSKKYGWTNCKEKLFGSVKKPLLIEE